MCAAICRYAFFHTYIPPHTPSNTSPPSFSHTSFSNESNRIERAGRPCHSAVHRSHDNETLGQSFFTVERLLADEKARKGLGWVVWAAGGDGKGIGMNQQPANSI